MQGYGEERQPWMAAKGAAWTSKWNSYFRNSTLGSLAALTDARNMPKVSANARGIRRKHCVSVPAVLGSGPCRLCTSDCVIEGGGWIRRRVARRESGRSPSNSTARKWGWWQSPRVSKSAYRTIGCLANRPISLPRLAFSHSGKRRTSNVQIGLFLAEVQVSRR